MHRVLIWDLPVRLFHWLLAGGCVLAASIALILGEDSRFFPYHAIIGLSVLLLVVFRVGWGIAGTRYARFRSFAFGPSAVVTYLQGVTLGRGPRHLGHNPGSAYAIFTMLALVAALGATGILLGRGDDGVEELHELLAYALIGVIGLHVVGVLVHSVRHRENITASMVHGYKVGERSDAITSAQPLVAVGLLLALGGWTAALIRNYDTATGTTTLPLFGSSLQLDEGGGDSDVERRESGEEREEGDR